MEDSVPGNVGCRLCMIYVKALEGLCSSMQPISTDNQKPRLDTERCHIPALRKLLNTPDLSETLESFGALF